MPVCSEMLLHHIASALSDTDSSEIMGKYCVCCLFIVMLDYYNSEKLVLTLMLWWKLPKCALEWFPCNK